MGVVVDLILAALDGLAGFGVGVELEAKGAGLALVAGVVEIAGQVASDAGLVGRPEGSLVGTLAPPVCEDLPSGARALIGREVDHHSSRAGHAFSGAYVVEEAGVVACYAVLASIQGQIGRTYALVCGFVDHHEGPRQAFRAHILGGIVVSIAGDALA